MKRTVSTPHLVLGIIFVGIAGLWLIGHATDAKIGDTAPVFPLILIGAGAIGLVSSLANARTRSRQQADAVMVEDAGVDPDTDTGPETGPEAHPEAHPDPDTEATTVITQENR